MNKWLLNIAFLLGCTEALAQSVTGLVVDNHKKPLEVVSVVLFEKSSKKPLAFTRTDADGCFTLAYPSEKEGNLFFTLLGYAKDSIDIRDFQSGQTVVLKEKPFQIKSVEIKAPRISQRGDDGRLEMFTSGEQLAWMHGQDGVSCRRDNVVMFDKRLRASFPNLD